MKKFTLVLWAVLIFIVLSIGVFADTSYIKVDSLAEDNMKPTKAVVTEIISDDYSLNDGYGGDEILTHTIYFNAKLMQGTYKGNTILVRQTFDEMDQLSSFPAKEGDKILVSLSVSPDGNLVGYAQDYVRDVPIGVLTAMFLGAIIAFGGMKGFKTVISLIVTCAALFVFFIPQILKGYSPILLSIATSGIIIVTTLALVIGFNRKSLSAAFGCMGGLVASGIITVIMQNVMKITGLVNEDSALLVFATQEGYIDLKGIVFAGIIIGALGATMDVAISIASSLDEVIFKAPDITPLEIVKSGFNIGRDILGTMSNTLLLAYVGSSLTVILLMYSHGYTASQMINLELVATEILQALAGSMGLLCTIPITAVITSMLYKKSVYRGEKGEEEQL